MNFHKIYEDENTLVIDKPAGIMVHEDGRSKEKSIADFLALEYPSIA